MKIIVKLSLIYLGLSVSFCQEVVEKKCNLACDQFVSCTEKIRKIKLSPDIKKAGHISCMDGCTTHNSDILGCFDQEPTSCKGFGNCVLQMGILE